MKEDIPALSSVMVLMDTASSSLQLDAVKAAGPLLNVRIEVQTGPAKHAVWT